MQGSVSGLQRFAKSDLENISRLFKVTAKKQRKNIFQVTCSGISIPRDTIHQSRPQLSFHSTPPTLVTSHFTANRQNLL